MGEPDANSLLSDAVLAELFRALAADQETYVGVVNRARQVLFLNRTKSRELSDVLGRPMEDFTSPDHRAELRSSLEKSFATGMQQSCEFAATLANGRVSQMRTRVRPVRGPNGEEIALMITSDETEKRTLSEQLKESMEFRRLVVENLPDFVVLLDRELRYVWVNRLAPGLELDDVIGEPMDKFTTPETMVQARSAIERAFSEGTIQFFEAEGYADANAQGCYQTRVVPIRTRGTIDNVLMITVNVTEQRRAERALRAAEEQLHQAQRMESIGQLAGGIAHDFNNLLQVLEGTLYFAKEGLRRGDSVVEELEQAILATERAAELTSHLLAIGRRKRVHPRRLDLGELVERSVRMLRRAIPEHVELRYFPPDSPCFVELDAPQFDQVLINLCVNARDAMPGGGTLEIRIEPEGPHTVVVTVRDTGEGIAPEYVGRVFEPFFTTKGAGSGLGLAVAAGIVAAHGGVLQAESTKDEGTTMRIRLPRSAHASDNPEARGEAATAMPMGSEVILVAEDEELVRAQVVRVLKAAGYRVLEAGNGARALELFRAHQSEVALVLLDAIMPELDGWQAFLQIERLNPGTKVLFSTGYSANVLPRDMATREIEVLSKPYKPEVLLAHVRAALDRSP